MANPIIFTITKAGKQALAKGNITLSEVAIGEGRDTVTGNETALSIEIDSADIISAGIEPKSEVLRFSAMLASKATVNVHEVGVKTSTGVLFAVALSGSQPFFTLNAGNFAASFGIALAGLDTARVKIQSTDTSPALSNMEAHLAAPNPHPQYLSSAHLDDLNAHAQYVDKAHFQALLGAVIPIGYLYHTHINTNPKPLFDELLGVETFWQRVTGKIIVATDPADPFVESEQFNLGKRGMTSDPISQQPNTYPLQTTHIWERLDPKAVKYDGKHKYDGKARYQ